MNDDVCACYAGSADACRRYGCELDPAQMAWIEAIDAGEYDEIARELEEAEEIREIIEWAGL